MLVLTKESTTNGSIRFSFEIPASEAERMESAVESLFDFIRAGHPEISGLVDGEKDEYVSADEVLGPVVPAQVLHGFRVREGLTQQQLADAVGVKQHHISEMENGKRRISKAVAEKLAGFFNTSYKAFL